MIFKPKTRIELDEAINLYTKNKHESIKFYGIINN